MSYVKFRHAHVIAFALCSLFLCGNIYSQTKNNHCCSDAPAPVYPIPTKAQLNWQKMERYAFIHFGLNTFNNLEWGYGDTPPSTFYPKHLDADQWARIIKAAGFKGIILTAKHHDGFCLWPTKTTEYNISKSPWKNGKGDVVRDLSQACKKYGLKFGLYLSPWDRHNANYAKPEYVKTFHAQMHELLNNYGDIFEYWFDGANGGDGWYGGAKERRKIDPKTYYKFAEARAYIKKLHPNAMIFGGTAPDIRWIGNERGYAATTNWCAKRTGAPGGKANMKGNEDGDKWLPGECDVSIRPGWFYHASEDHQVKTPAKLMDIYYGSIGRNANMLLNFPINKDGQISSQDSVAIMAWKHLLDVEFAHPILADAVVTASDNRGKAYAPEMVTDDNYDSYWSVPDTCQSAWISFKFPEEIQFNRLCLQEYIPLGQRVKAFKVQAYQNGEWQDVSIPEETTTIGYKRLLRFPTTKATALRILFPNSKGPVCINKIEAYLAPAIMSAVSQITRDAENRVLLSVNAPNLDIYYTTDGSEPKPVSGLKYECPFRISDNSVVKAVAYDPIFKKIGSVSVQEFDIAPKEQQLETSPRRGDMLALCDGNPATLTVFPNEQKAFTIHLSTPKEISGFEMMPNQNKNSRGHIYQYALYIDGKLVKEGTFANIKNNPIKQVVRFSPVRGQNVTLKALSIVDDIPYIALSDFLILTQ